MGNIGLPPQLMQVSETAGSVAGEKIAAQIKDASAALMSLKSGSLVFGTVTSSEGGDKGNLVLQTPLGKMVLQTPNQTQFPPGTQVSVQISNQPGQVKLLAADCRPLLANNLLQAASPEIAGSKTTAATPVALDIKGGALSATLLKPAISAEGQAALPQGTVLNVRIVNITSGEVPAKPVSPEAAGGEIPKANLPPGTSLAQASPKPAGEAAALPQQNNSKPLDNQPLVLPKEMPAIPTPQSTPGRPILQTPIGTIVLDAEIPLPPDAKLTLEVLKARPPVSSSEEKTAQNQPAKDWPNLDQALKNLEKENPQAARQLMNMMPAVNAKMAANMAMFTAAIRSGDAKQWLNEGGVKALGESKSGKETLKKIEAEFAENKASGVKSDAGGNQWQSVSIPFFNGEKVEPIDLFLKREKEKEGKSEGGGTRFLINLQLSQLGSLQIDGLVKDKERFDMIIRSPAGLSEELRKDITVIFANSCEACGMAGQVIFQNTRNFITPAAAEHKSVTV